MGRPTKYTSVRVRSVLEALRTGNPRQNAAALAGIHRDTFYEWLKQYSEFSDAVDRAEAEGEEMLLATIRRAAPANWQAAAWILERTRPQQYGRRDRLTTEEVRAEAERIGARMGLDAGDILAEANRIIRGRR